MKDRLAKKAQENSVNRNAQKYVEWVMKEVQILVAEIGQIKTKEMSEDSKKFLDLFEKTLHWLNKEVKQQRANVSGEIGSILKVREAIVGKKEMAFLENMLKHPEQHPAEHRVIHHALQIFAPQLTFIGRIDTLSTEAEQKEDMRDITKVMTAVLFYLSHLQEETKNLKKPDELLISKLSIMQRIQHVLNRPETTIAKKGENIQAILSEEVVVGRKKQKNLDILKMNRGIFAKVFSQPSIGQYFADSLKIGLDPIIKRHQVKSDATLTLRPSIGG